MPLLSAVPKLFCSVEYRHPETGVIQHVNLEVEKPIFPGNSAPKDAIDAYEEEVARRAIKQCDTSIHNYVQSVSWRRVANK